MFEEAILKMTRADQEAFAKAINQLLLTSFIVRDEFDRREKTIKINPTYRFIERHFDLINDYLSYSGWRVDKDLILGVFSLVNEYDHNRLRFDREVSLILFVLRLIYEEEKKEGGHIGDSIYLTTPLVMKVMHDRGILIPNKKLTGRLVGRALKEIANHNIIARVSGTYDEGNVTFYLLPSITFAVDNDKIVAISQALEKLALRDSGEGSDA
ncbi:MAG: DUF4194 domain-containing protein [Bacilli bacterium]